MVLALRRFHPLDYVVRGDRLHRLDERKPTWRHVLTNTNMTIYKLAFSSFLFVAVLLSGCSESATQERRSNVRPVPTTYTLVPSGQSQTDFAGMTDAQRERYFRQWMKTQNDIQDAMSRMDDWGEADRAVRESIHEAVESGVGIPAWRVESMAAALMLHRALESGQPSEASLSDIAYYTEMLVRNESPNAPLVADALDMLGETWTVGKVQQSAIGTVAAAERFERITSERAASRSGEDKADLLRREGDMRAGLGTAQDERQTAAMRRLRIVARQGPAQ